MSRKLTRVSWRRPAATLAPPVEESTPAADLAWARREMALRAFRQVGVPVVEGAQTAREYALGLLRLAAEVEHALMAQYLYAACSVLEPADDDEGENYHLKVMNVAIQEMGHLATVQNLLLILGGPEAFHMQRDELRKESEKNPIPFVLEPVDRPVLAAYVAAEKPLVVPPELSVEVDKLVALAKQHTGVEPHRVGAIYAVLRWLFLPEEEADAWLDLGSVIPPEDLPGKPHLTDADLVEQEKIAAHEALAEEWGVTGHGGVLLEAPRSCKAAADAIEVIAAQGEGLDDAERSHFAEFMQMVGALSGGKLKVRPMAKSPTLRHGHGGEGGEKITHPYTELWGRVFSLQYGSLVLSIYHTLSLPRKPDGDPGPRAEAAALAMECMKSVIDPVSALCASLPLRGDGSEAPCGPPFDLDPAVVEPADVNSLAARQLKLLDALQELYGQVENSDDPAARPDHLNELANLRDLDRRWRDLLTPLATPTDQPSTNPEEHTA